jgi:hypothetical protein
VAFSRAGGVAEENMQNSMFFCQSTDGWRCARDAGGRTTRMYALFRLQQQDVSQDF